MAANRTKTIEYALPMLSTGVTPQAEGTTYLDSADITIYIPETTSRAFKSVMLEVVVADNQNAVAGNVSGWGIRASCDAGTTFTETLAAAGYATSGENMSHVMTGDVTAEFTARFSGASDTCRWGFYVDYSTTGYTLVNASAKLYITYEYDDTAHSTRIKTVRIPIESYNGRLTTTHTAIKQASTAANQLPALKHATTPFLPEASTVIRQAFCEIWTNNLPSSTGNPLLTLNLDNSLLSQTFGLVRGSLASPITLRYLYDVTAADWTSAHELYGYHDVASQSHYNQLGGWLTVTYEYDHANSSTILNSIMMGMGEDSLNVGLVANLSTTSVERAFSEPGTLTLKQSGVWITTQTSASSTTLSFGMGSQTVTGYTPTGASTMAGMLSLVHRIDAGAHRGAGVTLTSGINTFTAQWYAANADRIGNVSMVMFLNYTSSKSTLGDGAHGHSVHYMLSPNNIATTANLQFTPTYTPNIIEPNYWLMSCMPIFYAGGITGATEYYVLQCKKTSEAGFGWTDIFNTSTIGGNERLFTISNAAARFAFKRWPNETESGRMDLETARDWRWYGTSCKFGLAMWITYHSMTFTVSGTVSGYTGDGSGLTVKVYRASDGFYCGSTTTAAGGTYTFTWYDGASSLYTDCYQDESHLGRSDNGTAT